MVGPGASPLVPRATVVERRPSLGGVVGFLFAALLLIGLAPQRVSAATVTWNGGSATSDDWMDGANWVGGFPPVAGDDLAFEGNTRLTPNNNFPANTSFHSITFKAGSGNFTVGGAALTLTGGSTALASNATGIMTIGAAITFDTVAPTISVTNGGGTLRLNSTATINNGGFFLTVTGAGTAELLGVISGSGGLIKTGSGTATLGAVNTYGASTTISSGTLRMGVANALPSGTNKDIALFGTLDLNGFATGMNGLTGTGTVRSGVAGPCTLTVGNNNVSSTFAGTIQNGNGTVALTKAGTGTLTLSGANTYTGATLISAAGTLRVTGSLAVTAVNVSVANAVLEGSGSVAGTVTVANGAIVSPGTGTTTIATLSTGAVTLGATSVTRVDLDGATPTYDRVATGGALNFNNSTLTINSVTNATKGRVYSIVGYTSRTGNFNGLADGAIVVASGRAFRVNYTATDATLTDITAVWDGGGSDDLWSTGANWVGDAVPNAGDAIVFAGGTRLTPNNDIVGGSYYSLTFAAGAGNFVLGGANGVTLTGGTAALTNSTTSGTMTIDHGVTFGSASTITVGNAGATLVLNGTVNNGGFLTTVSATGAVTVSATGVITGAGGLTKTGTGTMTLAGTNTYAGTTTISAGALRVTGSTAAGAVSVTGTLEGTGTIGGTVTVNAGGILSPGLGGSTIGATPLTTAGLVYGAGTAVTRIDLDGSATPTNDRVTNGGAINLNTSTLTINSATNISRAQSFTILSGTSISGQFLNLPEGSTVLANGRGFRINYNIPTGPVTLTDATSVWDGGGADDNWSNGLNWLGDVAPSAGHVLIFAGTTRLTPLNDTALSFSTINFAAGAGDFVLGGNAVTLTGGTTAIISSATSGTMTIGNALTMGSASTITSTAGGTLVFGSGGIANGGFGLTVNAGGPMTFNGVISGGGAFTKSGAGTLTLTAANTYNGATNFSAGTTLLGIANALPWGSGKGDITVGGTLDLGGFATAINGLVGGGTVTSTNPAILTLGNGATSTTFTGAITGAVAVTKVGGAVVQTFSGTNTYTGATTISAGTLRMGGNNSLPSGPGKSDVALAGILDLAGFNPTVNGLTGLGTVTNSTTTASILTVGNNNASSTFGGVIQNGTATVGLTKTGVGTIILPGASTYTGATAVNAGVLRITGSLATGSAVGIAGGTLEGDGTVGGPVTLTTGSIAPGNGGSAIATLTTGALTFAAGGSLVVDLDGADPTPTADLISTAGVVMLNGGLTIASNANVGTGKEYTIVSGGSVNGTFAGLSNGAIIAGGGRAFVINYTGTTVTLTDGAYQWDGGGADDNWSTAANWVGDVVPPAGSHLVFAGSTRLTPVNDLTGQSFASLSFSPGAGDFSLSGSAITLTSGATALISGATGGTMTISAPVVFSTAAPTISSAAGGTLVLGGPVDNGGLLLTVAAAGPVTLGGAVVGTGGLTKSGTGLLTLSGLNAAAASNFSGPITHAQGTLAFTGTVALTGSFSFGASAGSLITSSLDLSNGSVTFTGLMSARTNTVTPNTIVIGNGQALNLAGGLTLGIDQTAPLITTTTRLTASGAGAMNITGGNVQVGVSQTTADQTNNSIATLDVSALGGFATTTAVTNFNVGQGSTSHGYLSLSNTANTIIATTMNVGNSNTRNGVTGVGPNLITLGTGTNVIRCDTINIGLSKIDGTVTFASQAAGSPGTVTITNKAGNGAANITLGSNNTTNNTAATFTGLMDLRGHVATVTANAVQLGIGNNTNTGSTTGELRFDTGTFTANTLVLGNKAGTGGTGTATGLLSIGGGTFTVNTSVTTAINTAATGSGVGTISLTGGTFTTNGNITKTGGTNTTSTITVNGGTLNTTGRSIGSATQAVVFNLQSGALSNLLELNGGGTLTKSTAGTVTVSGTNAWSGATNIAAGTLVMGSANALPSGTGKSDVTVTGTFDLAGFSTAINGLAGAGLVTSSSPTPCVLTLGNNNASTTFSGIVQDGAGAVGVSKVGTGTQLLSNANTYTGATTINAGVLRVTGSTAAGSAVSIAGGSLEGSGTVGGAVDLLTGSIAPGIGGNTIATLTTGAITCAPTGTMVMDLDGSGPDHLVTAASVILDGGLSIASCTNSSVGTAHTIVTAGSLSGIFTGLPDGTVFNRAGHIFQVNYTATTVTLTQMSSAWDGGGADDLWSTAANWVGDVVPPPGSHLVFAGNTRLTPVNDLTGVAFASLNFSIGAGNFAISGNPITLTGGSLALSNGAQSGIMTVSAPIAFTTAAPTIVTVAGSTTILSGAIDNGGMTVTAASAGALTISGDLTGTGSLTKDSTGTLTMSGPSTYSGGTLVTRGDVVLASSGGAVSGPVGTGTLTLDSGTNAARVLLSGGQTVSNTLVMTTLSPGSGLGGLHHTGTGVATWSGPITLNANAATGGHFVGGANAANALQLTGLLTTGGSLTVVRQRSGFVIYAGTPGTLPQLDLSGTARLGVNDVFPAGMQIVFATGVLTGETGTLDLNGFNQTVTGLTFQNIGGGIVSTGVGTLTLNGNITTTFTGTPDANVNTISGNLDLAGGIRTITVADSAAATDLTISAAITNGSLTKAGTGVLAFTGTSANTYTGVTTIAGGTLVLQKTGAAAIVGDITIGDASGSDVLRLGASNQIADTSVISCVSGGAGNSAKFELNGYLETIAGLQSNANQATVLQNTEAGGAAGPNNPAILTIANTADYIYDGYIRNGGGGTVGLTKAGTGLLTLRSGSGAGNITYTGATTITAGRLLIDNLSNFSSAIANNSAAVDALTFNQTTQTLNLGTVVSGTGALTKTGTGQLTLSGATNNTYTGVTTAVAGRLHLGKNANIIAIPGDLAITGGQITLANNNPSNQIADASTVTMSGVTSVFNGSLGVNQQPANCGNVTETIASLIITGGNYNLGISNWSISGTFSMTGGGNTIFVGNSGGRLTAGSLILTGMTGTVGSTVDSFTLYGAQTIQSSITVGAGGLTLNGSVLNLRRGNATHLGSKLVLNGPLITAGTAASTIREDTSTANTTVGTRDVELSGIAGSITQTITTAGGGANLTISVPITNGAATPASLIKDGIGSLTTTTNNAWSGATTVVQGALYLVGTQATTAVTVDAAGTLGGSGTIAGTVALDGMLAPGTGGTTTGALNTGTLTWNTGAGMTVDLNGFGGVDSLVTPGQALAIDGPLTVASLINESPGQVFTILGANAITGAFSNAPGEGDLVAVGAGGKAVSVSYATPGVVRLTCVQPPVITAVSPDNGPMGVQTPITITGNFFDPTAIVLIGGVPATGVVVVDSQTIQAVTPAGAQGAVDVSVVNPGTSTGTLVAGYAYTGPVSTVTAISPASGPATTTTPVTITGTNFFPGTPLAVTIGGFAATAVTYVNATTITATVPAMGTGTDATADVVVTNGDRQQATLPNGFTYDVRPADDATGAIPGLAYRYHQVGGPLVPDYSTLVPNVLLANSYGNRFNPNLSSNPIEARNDNWSMEFGGYVEVPVDGIYTFFTASDDGSKLFIGTTEVVNNNFPQGVTERSGQIALAAGKHRLRVEFAQGNGLYGLAVRWQGPTLAKADIPDLAYFCDPTPMISTVSPDSGPQGGGTVVTITGSGFVPGSLVAIGGVLAISPIVVNENTISVTTPGGSNGAKDVLVIGPRSSGTTRTGAFTYLTSAAPTFTAIAPTSGSALGGTPVTLTVSNVDVTPVVTFNGVAATSVVRVNASTVTCVTPAMPLSDATADVTVTVGGQSATLANGYTWTLRTPENPSGTQPGLAYSYYHSGGPTLPTFSSLTPFSTGITGSTASPTVFGWTANPIEPAYTTNFSLRYLGYLTVPADGVYTLETASDDGSRLYIGSTLVVDNNFAQSVTPLSGIIALAAGTHLMTVEYAQGGGGFGLYVRWQGPNLTKVDIPNSAFTTDPTPTLDPLTVTNGPQSGGTVMTITGTGFVSGATVTFGGTNAVNVVVQNPTTIQLTTPSHATGTVSVVVTNPTGTSATLTNAFTYDPSAAPTITNISPASGPADGGTTVTVTGTGFGAPMTVTIGGRTATVQSVTSNSITVVTPPMQGATLTVDVTVTNGAAQSATLVGGFTYLLRVPENPGNLQAGLTYRYHRVAGPLLPSFTGLTPYSIGVRNTPVITVGNPGAANPFDAGYNTNWSVEYRGYITVPTDNIYTFFTESDDGSQLLIGSGVVVANNFAQGMTERSGSIGLQAGTHQLTIRFAQGTGNFGLNVRWQSSAITKALIPDNVLWTDATPTFTAATPNAGTNAGGNTVTITGSGFTSGTTVTFGGTAATGVVVAPDGLSLTAVAPAHAIGQVAVVVANGNGLAVTQNNAYLYQGPAPTITAVSPIGGPVAGGTTILIYGTNFAAGATVTVGGAAATNVSVSAGVISARTPPGTLGPADVTVTNIDATSVTRSPGFYYQGPAPTIATVSPTNGPMAGGTTVTITGTNFTTGATVTFDGVAAASTTVNSSTSITVVTAAGAQGPADIVVTNNDMRSVTSFNGFVFEGPAPTVTAIAPASGPVTGGTSVTITGTNFAAGAVVDLDGVAATGVTVVNGTTITATTPAGTQGPVDVTVTNVDFLADTLPASYIYLGPAPAITGISPTAVPINYTTTNITISGSGFATGVTVTVQGQTATIVSVAPTAIVFNLPASGLVPGPAQVVVTNVDLQSAILNGFVVQGPAPILTGIDVPHGPVAGGRRMTLTGSAFRTGATVTLGGVPATGVVVVDANTITAMTPAHGAGAVTVTVTNDDLLSSSLVNAYTYYEHDDDSTTGNGCGTGGGLAVLLFVVFLSVGGFGRRR